MSTTEARPDGHYGGFYSNGNPEIGPVTILTHPDPAIAVISLGNAGTIYLRSAALARELLKAAAEAVQILDPPRPVETVCLPEAEMVCGRCGATREHGLLVTADGLTRCHNRALCAERAAARDAEAAQVTL